MALPFDAMPGFVDVVLLMLIFILSLVIVSSSCSSCRA